MSVSTTYYRCFSDHLRERNSSIKPAVKIVVLKQHVRRQRDEGSLLEQIHRTVRVKMARDLIQHIGALREHAHATFVWNYDMQDARSPGFQRIWQLHWLVSNSLNRYLRDDWLSRIEGRARMYEQHL